MKILVTGGTGVIGRPAVDRLIARGHLVRLLSRRAERDAEVWDGAVEPWPGSVGDAATVQGAAEGCDAVLHIAGIVEEDPPEVTFAKVNVEGTRRLVEEAQRAGVHRFVYISSLGADEGASDYHASKREAEGIVRRFGGEWLILRPGNVYGPRDGVISTLLQMVRTLPAIPTVGSGEQRFQPLHADDLAEVIERSFEEGAPSAEALDLAGEEVTTTREILDLLREITGRNPPSVPLPGAVLEGGMALARKAGFDLPIGEDVLTMLDEENVIREGRVNALTGVFGVRPLPLREGLARLADAQPERLPTRGVGPLHRHRYWSRIRGSALDADALFEVVCREFGTLVPEALLEVDAEGRGQAVMEPGASLTLAIPMRGTIQVRVEEVKDRAATSVTLEGHPLSGMIRFLVKEEAGDEAGVLRFEVRSYFRHSNLADRAVMATVGGPLQDATWRSFVEAVVERSGGEAIDGVREESGALADDEAAHVERWIEDLVLRREAAERRAGLAENAEAPSS